jgi:predicted aldo/keto reductase-like oxidoreductase
VKIPEIFSFRSNSKRLSRDVVMLLAKDPMESAEKCNECGECLEKCPYKLPIPEVLRETVEAYKQFVGRHS